MKNPFLLLFLLLNTLVFGQQTTQTITGLVQDKQTKQILVGASIVVNNTNLGTISDENGAFMLEKVPIGRVSLKCQFIGYQPLAFDDIILTSTQCRDKPI